MVGAGGAGSSIAVSMMDEGARHLTFHDINAQNRQSLLERLQTAYPGRIAVEKAVPVDCDIVVNASSAGLKITDPLPIDPSQLKTNMVTAEVIADPVPTRLLAEAA